MRLSFVVLPIIFFPVLGNNKFPIESLYNVPISFFLLGRWVKIETHQVPTEYFEYFLSLLNVEANSVKDASHKAQPMYRNEARKVSYKIFDINQFTNVLGEQNLVTFHPEVSFSGEKEYRSEPTEVLTAEEEIEQAKQRGRKAVDQRRRLSSKSTLVVGYGEGRANREVELIWWPNLYTFFNHGQLAIRIFIEKCEF